MEDILDMGGGNGRGQDPAMEAGGGSERGTATIRGVKATTEARKATPKYFLGGHTGRLAEVGFRPEPTPHAYRGTGQASCYAVMHTVSPVRPSYAALESASSQNGIIRLSAPGLQDTSLDQDILRRLYVLDAQCVFTAQCILCQRPALIELK